MKNIAFLIAFVIYYLIMGIVYSTTELKHKTGIDTWQNVWKNKGFVIKNTILWAYYIIKFFVK